VIAERPFRPAFGRLDFAHQRELGGRDQGVGMITRRLGHWKTLASDERGQHQLGNVFG
jgi:hypothetical protein